MKDLKDHVTLKTGVMILNIQFYITGIHLILKYIKKKTVILNSHNISQNSFFVYFWLNKCSIVTHSVREKNIWSPADFVHLPIDKEMISLSF